MEQWLETDSLILDTTIKKSGKNGNLSIDKTLVDFFRLGYVAFSRARELLCIACLEKIDDSLLSKIRSLNIKVIPEEV